ncbi:MAG: PP2C family protein-serine/threonine phosphatase [Planctomycetota bacterium]
MTTSPVVQYASRTDVGMRRAVNQDSFAVRLCTDLEEWTRFGHLFVVADGIGGHAVGDLASRICVDTLPLAFVKHADSSAEDSLHYAILAANKAINDRGRENREFEGMGTTCTALSLSAAGAIAGHVGDSRLYRVRRGLIQQLTFDHSLQWEMIRLGRATPENVERFHPRNVITRCLGPDAFVQVDIEGPFPVESGDIYMLCSDGVTNHVSDAEIGMILSNMPPAESARLLINLANLRGGFDNSTVIAVNVESYPAPGSPEPPIFPVAAPTHVPAVRRRSFARNAATVAVLLFAASLAFLTARLTMARLPAGPGGFLVATVTGTMILFVGLLLALRIRRSDSAATPTAPFHTAVVAPAPAPVSTPSVATAPLTQPDDFPGTDSDQHLLRSSFNSQAPYRSVPCVKADELFNFLAEAHSELIQASRDNSWNVDLEELTQLDRQATVAIQAGKLDRALRARGRAIDIVMREIPQKQTPRGQV